MASPRVATGLLRGGRCGPHRKFAPGDRREPARVARPDSSSLGRDFRPVRVSTQTPSASLPVRASSFEDASATGPHILTVALEDYYHVGAFNRVIQRGQWYRFERRIEASTLRTLDLLDEFRSRATFFVLGWVADTMPELIRVVAERGHEIASKGYYHRNIRQLTPAEFRDDLARAREALERAGGHRILGYRVADDWFQPADLWALDVLADEGYEYDSSVGPIYGRTQLSRGAVSPICTATAIGRCGNCRFRLPMSSASWCRSRAAIISASSRSGWSAAR